MRPLLIGILHLTIGVGVSFGWVTYGDSQGFVVRPFDMFVNTILPMGFFIITAAIHAYWAGRRHGRKKSATPAAESGGGLA